MNEELSSLFNHPKSFGYRPGYFHMCIVVLVTRGFLFPLRHFLGSSTQVRVLGLESS